jgi:FkbH-like protein
MNICLISSYTSQLMKNILEEKLRNGNINASISISEYNIVHDLISNDSMIYQSQYDFIVLLFLLEDIKDIEELISCLRICRPKITGALLISNFIAPAAWNLHNCNQPEDNFSRFSQLQTALKQFLINEKPANTYLLDFNSLAAKLGHDHFFDPRLRYAYQIPFTQKGMEAVSQLINRAVQCLTLPRKKCIVLDCDNTLWGGIIGEDGMDGIKLGSTYPGNCYVKFQEQLLELKNLGYILALNSKNNEHDVLEVLEHHPWQILKSADFVSKKINWNNKIENFMALTRELNLGLDSFVFFDDNPAEIYLIKDNLPEITAIEVPKDNPVKIISLIEDNFETFDILKITEEDKAKTEMYLANIAREELKKSVVNIDDYYKSLDMTMEIRKNIKTDVPRLSQMTLKTNQFNLVTIRRTEEEIINLLGQVNFIVYCFKLVDRFGDNGIVGYCEVKTKTNHGELLNFLMSCRVIGRNAENEFLTQILQDLQRLRIKSVSATWEKTAKNAICENFYENFGFTLMNSNAKEKKYHLDLHRMELSSRDYFQVLWRQEPD